MTLTPAHADLNTLDPNAVVTADLNADNVLEVRYDGLRVVVRRSTSLSNPLEVWGVVLRDPTTNHIRLSFEWTAADGPVCVLYSEYGDRSLASIPPKLQAAAALAVHIATTLSR